MLNKARHIYQNLPEPLKLLGRKLIVVKNLFYHRGKLKSSVYDKATLKEYNNSRPFGPQNRICHAPFTSMFFSVFGKASPCYATYYKLKNTIPASSIDEIWNGDDFEELRKNILNGDLREFCSFCHVPMLSKTYGSMLSRKYDNFQFYGSRYPSIMEFELSNRCNLECIMCNGFLSSGIRKNREQLPPLESVYDDNFVEQLKIYIPHLKIAEFTGGDPFLIEIYYKIWALISEINPACNILITTNGNTMNERIEKLMQKHKKISFNISIDTLKPETYPKIRVNGDFEKVMKNIDTFIQYAANNNTQVNLMVCPLQINRYELPDFVNFCNSRGINVYYHTVMKPQELSLWSLPASELDKLYQELTSCRFPESNGKEKINSDNFKALCNQVGAWHKQALEKEKSGLKINIELSDVLDTQEKTFINSVISYYSEHFAKDEPDPYKTCTEIATKLELVFAKLPTEIDRKVFLSLPLDGYLYEIMKKYEPDYLVKLIIDWVNNKPINITIDAQ